MSCPICRKPDRSADYRPFCSRRCADVDLGRWLTGSYAIPADEDDADDPADRDPETTARGTPRIKKIVSAPLDSPRAPRIRRRHPSAQLRRTGAQIAQLVEQRIENPRVAGSIPALGTT